MRARETEWQIESQNGESRRGERIGHLHQQFRLAVCAGAVREHDGVPSRLRRHMQETMNGGLTLKIIKRDRHGVVKLYMKGPVASTIFQSETGNGQRLGARCTARRNLYGLPIPWTHQNRIVRVRWLQSDFGPADNHSGNGLNPGNFVPVRSEQITVMGAVGFGVGCGAVEVHGIGAAYRDALVDGAVQACCMDGVAVAFSAVGYLSNRCDWPQSDNRKRQIARCRVLDGPE